MLTKLLRTLLLGVVLGIGSCKAPLSSGGSGGSTAPATGLGNGGSTGTATGGIAGGGSGGGLATGGTPGTGGSGTGGSIGSGTGGIQGTGGSGSGGDTSTMTRGTQGTGGSGRGGDTSTMTGGMQGTGGSGTGGGPSTGGNLGTGGSSTTSRNPLDLVPLDNDVSGWLVDRDLSRDPKKRAMTATTLAEAEALIDGAAAGYFREPDVPKLFLWQNYINSTLRPAPDSAAIMLFIFEMPSVDQAKGLYTAVLQQPDYQRKLGAPDDWQATTPAVGTASRILDTGVQWWINFYKGVFYVEILLSPSYGPPPDYETGSSDTKDAALRFAQAIAARI